MVGTAGTLSLPPMEVRRLERRIAAGDREPTDRTRHPMRLVTEEVVTDAASWTGSRARDVQALFDDLAGGWRERFIDDLLRLAPLEDALARGGITAFGRCLDLGSGTGEESALLTAHFDRVVS